MYILCCIQGWGKALSNSLSHKHKHLKFFKHKHKHKHYPGIHDLGLELPRYIDISTCHDIKVHDITFSLCRHIILIVVNVTIVSINSY